MTMSDSTRRYLTRILIGSSRVKKAAVAGTCPAEPDPRPDALRLQSAGLLARHRRPRALADAYRTAGRHQQQDQGHQAHGLWLPRQRLLLPEDQSRLPRESVKNQKKPRKSRGYLKFRTLLDGSESSIGAQEGTRT